MLSLSWVSKAFLVITICVLPQPVLAEWISAEGKFSFTNDVTKGECFGEAVLAAKRSAMSKFGLEVLASLTSDFCVEAGSKTNCELHQQTLNYFDGGYIAEVRNLVERREGSGLNELCVATLEADVRKYSTKPDPAFLLSAEITGGRRKFHGDEFSIRGEALKGSFIYVFGYYPTTDGDKYFLLAPNDFDEEIVSGADGFFQVPSLQSKGKYSFEALFPGDIKKDEITEYLIILALKEKLPMLAKVSSEEHHRNLHRIGRQNWKQSRVGYSILKKE